MQKPKGTKDYFGKEQNIRQTIINVLEEISKIYRVSKIETPIFESKEVFVKSVGETSDIVSKEMFEFRDKGDRDMVLRPEGTAGVIRALVENKLYAQKQNKFFYIGPMFRYENPQKGRQRQFTQYGVEVFGDKNPIVDVELISMADYILKALNIKFKLVINSLGDKETRDKYSHAIKEYLSNYKDQLSEDSLKRLDKNPLRILDDKVDGKKDFIANAPKLSSYYSESSKSYFEDVQQILSSIGIEFEISEKLVRGLDYYTDIVFEFISTSGEAGSQSTLLAGGRYDNLVKQSGGPDLSGIGFALGIERLTIEMEANEKEHDFNDYPFAYVCAISEGYEVSALDISSLLRNLGYPTEFNNKQTKIQKALEKYEASNAMIAIFIGEKEMNEQSVIVRIGKKQEIVKLDDLMAYIEDIKNGENENEDN